MLVTGAGGDMHARPMAIAELKPDADAYFVTAIDAPKVAEISANPNVPLCFQSSSEFASRSLRGTNCRTEAMRCAGRSMYQVRDLAVRSKSASARCAPGAWGGPAHG